MPEKITCPSCRAIISEDGETVYTQSPRLKKATEIAQELTTANKRIDALEAKLESPAPKTKTEPELEVKKKGFADEFFED